MPSLCERNPDISLIIPVYNLERFLQPMLDSLAVQNLGDYTAEIIFVLNNCTDDSEGVIRRSRIACRIINCTTQGCGPARNAGYEIATGKYIWFLDGDDWLTADTAVRDVLDKAYAVDANIIYIPFESKTFTWQYFSMVPQYLLRREFVSEFRFPDYQPAEDDAYMHNVLTKAGVGRWGYVRLPKMDRPYYYYNYGREGSNMMRVASGEKI